MSSTRSGETVAIVGAGMSGLVCAQSLQAAGWRVTVFEKSRSIGGRLATRRADYGTFDHGAQYFTARDPRFKALLEHWTARGLVAVWTPRLIAIDTASGRPAHAPVGQSTIRYVGVPGMNRVGRTLADGLELHTGCRIIRARSIGSRWQLVADPSAGGTRRPDAAMSAHFDWVVAAMPSPQVAALFDDTPLLRDQALALPMVPCWALLLRFDAPLPLDFDAAFVTGSSLTWIARDSSKPGRQPGEYWVAHAARDWSETVLERSPDSIAIDLQAEFARVTDIETVPVAGHAHRWRYSGPGARSAAQPCLFEPALRAGACGDWLSDARVEGAWSSGLALAERMLAARP